MAKRKVKADQRAVVRGGGWTGIPHVVQDSAAFQALSDRAVRVLLCIVRAWNGYNNGKIGVSVRNIAEVQGHQNLASISKAIAELMDHGFIDVATEGQWKARLARKYRLTFVSTGDHTRHVQATEDYRQWSPRAKSGVEDASTETAHPVEDVSTEANNPVEDVSTRIALHRRKSAIRQNPAVETSSTYIIKPYPAPETGAEIDQNSNQSFSSLVGPSVANHNLDAGDPQTVIAATIRSIWSNLSREERLEAAGRHGLSIVEIDRWLGGSGHLPFPKIVALRSTTMGLAARVTA